MDYNTENEKLSREAGAASSGPAGKRAAEGVGPYDMREKPAYWAVLPAAIRYDPEIPASAKLLYAEISALTDQRGYCWASNAYFEGLYGLSERTIVRLIRALEKAGYIRILEAGGGATRRKIAAGINPLANPSTADAVPLPLGKGVSAETPDKNVSTPRQKCQGGGDKNVRENNREIKKENDPPKAPQGAGADYVPKKSPDWKPERWEKFWAFYPLHKSKQAAIKAWDRLKPSDELLAVIGHALVRQIAEKQAECKRNRVPFEWKIHASTYLNGARWTDEDDTSSAAGAAPSPQGEGFGGQDSPAPSERRDVLWI